MKTLISNPLTNPQFTTFISHFPSLRQKVPIFLNFPIKKPPPTYKLTTSFCSYSADYGGWEDLSSGGDSGESNQLKRLLSSLGIDEKKYAFVYLLGFVCALAVSRVRVSSIIVFPACFLVFAVGFSFGIVNGGSLNEVIGLFGSNSGKNNKKKRLKDDEIRVSVENLGILMDLLNGFDVNVVNLKNSMRKDVDSSRISRTDLLSYIEGVESIGQTVLQAKSMIESYTDNIIVDINDISKSSNQKPSNRTKGFDISQFITGFREKSFGSRPNKVKDSVKNDSISIDASDPRLNQANILYVQENTIKSIYNDDKVTSNDDFRVKETVRGKEMDMEINGLFDSGFGANLNHKRMDELFFQERQNFKNINGNRMPKTSEKESYASQNENKFASSPSLGISDDILFNEYLTKANSLLKQARECLRHKGIEENTEKMLNKSTELLSKAVEMKPMSLLAVGQLGNTYLLRGELKLKISRKLRVLLAESDYNNDEVDNREKYVDYLVNVCEECEELLVEAGRKYRLALSIDGNDMRSLYNWGLALSFRAQLIADIGPEAAFDADKVYMAAIDKFDAMMSKSNTHTPDALFRWGVALQQRSRLRTRNFREKVKLLSQAKRLYEDALLIDSNNLQVKEALLTCESELRYKNYC